MSLQYGYKLRFCLVIMLLFLSIPHLQWTLSSERVHISIVYELLIKWCYVLVTLFVKFIIVSLRVAIECHTNV